MSEIKFARFVVRPDCKGGMVGFNFGLFKEGAVYEAQEIGGEIIIAEVGPSWLERESNERPVVVGACNGRTYNDLYREFGGRLVMTKEALIQDTERRRLESNQRNGKP